MRVLPALAVLRLVRGWGWLPCGVGSADRFGAGLLTGRLGTVRSGIFLLRSHVYRYAAGSRSVSLAIIETDIR